MGKKTTPTWNLITFLYFLPLHYSSACAVSISKRIFKANERQKIIAKKQNDEIVNSYIFFEIFVELWKSLLKFGKVGTIFLALKNELYHKMHSFLSFKKEQDEAWGPPSYRLNMGLLRVRLMVCQSSVPRFAFFNDS